MAMFIGGMNIIGSLAVDFQVTFIAFLVTSYCSKLLALQ